MALKCRSCEYWDRIKPTSDYCAKGKLKDPEAEACAMYKRAFKKYDIRSRWSIHENS